MNLVLLILFLSSYSVNIITEQPLAIPDCSYKNIKLNGKVQFVDSFPDFKVQIVESFPDFKVKYVESFPGKP